MASYPSLSRPLAATRMILATATEGLPHTFAKTCFHPLDESDALQAFQQAGLWLGPRETLERLDTFRQIIPYVVLRIGDQFIRYTRTPAGGESRLHGRMSIGLGGHIDLSDVVANGDGVDLAATLQKAAQRELAEELGDVDCWAKEWIGVLVDNESDVGRVHIGIVGVWHMHSAPTGMSEDAIGDVSVCSIEELEHVRNRLEGWSVMLLPYFKDIVAA